MLIVTLPIVQRLSSQQGSRMALTAAIWDDGSLRIDGYPLGLDRAEYDGHTYSDKAPGQPVLAVPAYALYRALGGEPARQLRVDGNLGLWVVSVWCSALPAAVLVLLVRRAAGRIDPRVATVVAATTALSTLVLPFSTLLFGHVLAAAFALGGWLLATAPNPSRRVLMSTGLALGAAVLTEYTLVFAALAATAHVLLQHRRAVGWVVLGALPAVVALLAYQAAAFGSAFTFSYSSSSFGHTSAGIGQKKLDPSIVSNSARVLFGERGLLLTTPLVVVGLVGTVALLRREHGAQRTAVMAAAASAASVICVQLLWSNPTGGDSPGARYATAAAVFLVPGLAAVWTRLRLSAVVCAGTGAALMLAATWTEPLEGRDTRGAIGIWLRKLARGDWALTTYEMAWGSAARWILPISAIGAGAALVAAVRAEGRPD